MKKILAGIMALVLLCTGLPVFAEEFHEELHAGDEYKDGIPQEPIEISYQDALGSVYFSDIDDYTEVGILSALGIMGPKEGNMFKPNVYISRAEFVEGVLKFLNIDYDSFSTDNAGEFYDVDESNEYYNAIYAALASKIIVGYGDNTFRPNSVISYNEAVTCIMRALGYTNEFQTYMKTASDIGVTKSVHVKNSLAVTRIEMARLLYNALEAPTCMQILKVGTNAYKADGETVLSYAWHTYSAKGTVESSFTQSMIPSMHATKNSIIIDGVRYRTDIEDNQYFMGYYVNYYYDDDENLVYMYKNKNVDEVVIDADDFVGYNPQNRTISYDVNGRTKTKSLDISYTLFYNGMIPEISYDDSIFNIKDGQIKLVSNNNGNTYTSVFIEEYTNYILKRTAFTNQTVTFLLDKGFGSFDVNLDTTYLNASNDKGEKIEIYRKTSSGEDAYDVSGFKADSVISVYPEYGQYVESGIRVPNTYSKYMKIVVSEKKVNGVVREFDTEEETIKIDDTNYKLSNSRIFDEKLISIGDSYSFYLDFDDQLVATTEVDADDDPWAYAYLIKPYYDPDEEKLTDLMLFTTDEIIKNYPVIEKLRINGNTTKPDKVLEKLHESAMLVNATTGMNFEYSQLLKFKTNSEGVVTDLQTITAETGVAPGYDSDTQIKRSVSGTFVNNDTYTATISEVKPGVTTTMGTHYRPAVTLRVPTTETKNPDYYAVTPVTGISGNFQLDIYDVTDLKPAIAVYYKDSAESAAIPTGREQRIEIPVMLGKRNIGMNNEGEVVLNFTVAQAGTTKEYYSENLNLLDGYKVGDLLYLYGADKNVTKVLPIMYKGKHLGPDNLPDITDMSIMSISPTMNTFSPQFYEVYSVPASNHFVLQNGYVTDGNIREHQVTGMTCVDAWMFGGILMYSTDGIEETVGVGSVSDLRGAENYGTQRSTKVIAFAVSGGARQYIIYNFD